MGVVLLHGQGAGPDRQGGGQNVEKIPGSRKGIKKQTPQKKELPLVPSRRQVVDQGQDQDESYKTI